MLTTLLTLRVVCVFACNSLEECEDAVGGDESADHDESLMLSDDDVQQDAQTGSRELHVTNGKDPVLPVNQALLDEMNALSIELSAFTSLLVDECSDDSDDEALAPVIRDLEELQPLCDLQEADSAVPSVQVNDTTTNVQASACEPAPARAQSTYSLSKIVQSRPPPRHHQSKLQKFLRAHPPKPNSNHTKRSKTHAKTRSKPQQQLHSHMREILSSPTLWKEYQSKSFQQHIRRQQQARHVAEQESIEAEKAAAAHFKRAKYALKLGGACPEKSNAVVRSAVVHDTTYLRRFCKDRRRPQPPSQQELQQTSPYSPMLTKGLLCGVYLYGKPQLGLAYFTCTSLPQLHEKVCARFGISSVLNFYRERAVITSSSDRQSAPVPGRKRTAASKTFQRITSFHQVHDGDRLCATRDSYEDMTILCEWIKQRQQRIHHMQQQPNEPPTPSSPSSLQPGECKSKTAQCRPATTTSALPAQMEENTSLWDANGRCMAVKKQLIV